MSGPRRIAFRRIANAALAHADVLVPRRADHRKGSFKINLTTGRWSDFATGDAGGDLVSLAAYRGRHQHRPGPWDRSL